MELKCARYCLGITKLKANFGGLIEKIGARSNKSTSKFISMLELDF